jgi:hypothetical protein
MQVMTHDEMRQLNGGNVACGLAATGWAIAETSLIFAFASGGIGFGLAAVGMGIALYGMMSGCAG